MTGEISHTGGMRSFRGRLDNVSLHPSVFTLRESRTVEKALNLIEKKCIRGGNVLRNEYELQQYLILRFSGLTNEQLHVLYLNTQYELIEARVEYLGIQSHCQVDIKRIARNAILLGAEHLILAHNHPSGCLTASDDDIKFTTSCENALHQIGVNLLESYVVTSFATASIKIARETRREQELARWRAENEQRRSDRRAKIAAKKATEQIAQDIVEFLPLLAQYNAIKAENPGALLFYRMGDFYELFFEDAEIAAGALGIVLKTRGKPEERGIPMCGVPVERAEDYLNRLIGQGHHVAICELVSNLDGPYRREVVRVAKPGVWPACDDGQPIAL
ncbi:MAG: JAB domain-containing protein [Methylocella sp.]